MISSISEIQVVKLGHARPEDGRARGVQQMFAMRPSSLSSLPFLLKEA